MKNTTLPNVVYPVANATASTNPFVDVFDTRDPNGNDLNYPVQKKWLNTATGDFFILVGFTSAGAVVQAIWEKIAGMSLVETLTGNSGGAISPILNNFDIVGDGTYITTSGNPATATLTISPTGAITTLYTENSGTATPMSGNLNVLGGTGISTVGSGNTITINATGSVSELFTEDTGTATPSGGNLNIFGGTGIATSGTGSTVTIAAAASVATIYVEDTGTATPATNSLTIAGGTGISTSGAGHTVTISAAASVATTYNADSGSATPAANVLILAGGTGISTSASGHTVTFSATDFAVNYTNVNHAASPYTVLAADEYISVDCSGGVVTLNFPNAPTAKRTWTIKDRTGSAATNNITITTPGGTVTFDGSTSYVIKTNYEAINLLANATPTYEVW